MSNEKGKEKISLATYGDLVVDCADYGVQYGMGTFFLSLIAIPVTLRRLDKLVKTTTELKACAAVFGSLIGSIYITKKLRADCDKKLHEQYDI